MNPLSKLIAGITGLGLSIALLIGVMFLFMFGIGACANFHRNQAIKNTKNSVVKAQLRAKNSIILTDIEVTRYQQQKRIERLKAQVRFIHSVGIRRAQDEIAKTLTPLYVAFEMTQGLQAIATSGNNNSVIYVPTNTATGLPIVPGLQPTTGGK